MSGCKFYRKPYLFDEIASKIKILYTTYMLVFNGSAPGGCRKIFDCLQWDDKNIAEVLSCIHDTHIPKKTQVAP